MSCKLEFILSSRGTWSATDPGGKKQAMYDRMLEFLKGEQREFWEMTMDELEEERHSPDANLIAWYNRHVFISLTRPLAC